MKTLFLLLAILCGGMNALSQQYFRFTIESNPQGIIPTTTGYLPAGAATNTPNVAYGETSGYYFGYWTLNGVRQQGVLGDALTVATLPMTNDEVAVAVFVMPGESENSDLQTWIQMFWFGSTNAYSSISDPTGDGFTIGGDFARGYSPVISNVTTNGGALLRMGNLVTLVPPPVPQLTAITTLPTPSPITFGQSLTSSTLTGGIAVSPGGTVVPGSFSFTKPSTDPAGGTNLQNITFTPSDTVFYYPSTTNIPVVVDPATPTVTVPAFTLVSGQVLSNSLLTNGMAYGVGSISLHGTFTFSDTSAGLTNGTNYEVVVFTPMDMLDYSSITTSVTVVVILPPPTIITPPTASSIIYGETLANSALINGLASVPGLFTFTDPTAIPLAGTNAVGVTFTPTNGFPLLFTNVNIVVLKALPTITFPPLASSILYGQSFASSTLSGGSASVPGNFRFTDPTKQPPVGTNTASVTFVPTDTNDFSEIITSTTLIVGKASPLVTWRNPPPIFYGTGLGSNQLNATASVDGISQYTPPAGTILGVGTNTLSVVFVPTDTTHYSSVTDSVSLAIIGAFSLPLPSPRTPGRVVAWGDNRRGQTKVPAGLGAAVAIAAGEYHNLVVTTNSNVVAWGSNSAGQTNVPAGLTGVVAVAAGIEHSLALTATGSLVAWGGNSHGQINLPNSLPPIGAIAAGGYHSLALTIDGTVVAWGDNSYGQTNVPAGLIGVVQVAAGENFSSALMRDGTVIVWGDNSYGQGHVPAVANNLLAVAGGADFSLGLTAGGVLTGWGGNAYGQLKLPLGLAQFTAIAASDLHSLAILDSGGVIAWGDNTFGEANVPSGVTNAVGVAAGYFHCMAIVSDTPILAQTPPELAITRGSLGSGQPLLSLAWSSNAPAYTLQRSAVLGANEKWFPAALPSFTDGTNIAVLIAPNTGTQFFRIGRP